MQDQGTWKGLFFARSWISPTRNHQHGDLSPFSPAPLIRIHGKWVGALERPKEEVLLEKAGVTLICKGVLRIIL